MRNNFFLLVFLHIASISLAEGGEDRYIVINPNGHKSTIKCMEVDSKGKVVTAGYDKTVKIWNTKDGFLEREIRGQIGPGSEGLIYSMALSSDDKYLATGGWFGNTEGTEAVGDIRLFDYKSGKQIARLQGHVEGVIDLEFYGNANYLLSVDGRGNVMGWKIDDLSKIEFEAIPKDITDLEVLGEYFVTAHLSGMVYLWNPYKMDKPVYTYKKLHKMQTPAMCIATSDDGSRVAVSSANYVYILNSKLKEFYSFYHGTDWITKMNYSADSRNLIIASSSEYLKENLVQVYQETDEKYYALSKFTKHSDAIQSADFISNDLCVTAGGRNNEVAIWKVDAKKRVAPLVYWMRGVGSAIHAAGMSKNKICFATTWTKNDGFSAYEFLFDFENRQVTTYLESDSGTFPVHKKNDYELVLPDLETLKIKKGKVVLTTIVADNTNGTAHMVVSFVNDSVIVSGGGYGSLIAYNLQGKRLSSLIGHEGDVRGLSISKDGNFLISGSQDQTIRLWKTNEIGKKEFVFPTASVFVGESGDWVVWNQEGYFMSSKKGASYVGFHINQGRDKEAKYYPFEQFDAKYNRPDIILKGLGFIDQSIIDLYYGAYKKRLYRMGIEENELGTSMNSPIVEVKKGAVVKGVSKLTIEAHDSLFTLISVQIYINDVPVFGRNGKDISEMNQKNLSRTFELELMSGVNKVQVTVTNAQHVESFKETITINNPDEEIPALYILSVGVSEYLDSNYNLHYAAKDAEDFAGLLEHSPSYTTVHKKVLQNQDVTRKNLIEIESFFSEASRDDIVIFFIAGHGVLNIDFDYYFCTYDMDFLNPSKNGMAYSELEKLFDGIKAIRKLLIMDTCHSGELDKNDLEEIAFVPTEESDVTFRSVSSNVSMTETQGLKRTNEAVKEMFNDLRRGTGATVISSAGGAEYAMESDDWKNGLFTYCLLEGITTMSADSDKNGQIILSELQQYITSKVSELSGGKQMPTTRVENLSLDYRIW